jgi:hypothetical protein
MEPFYNKFPKIAKKETRSITILKKGSFGSLPADHYTFLELYCSEENCDCRRVMISVISENENKIVATINMAFDSDSDDPGPFLDPINPQSAYSDDLIKFFVELINHDPEYLIRLQRHYVIFKEKVDGKAYEGRPFETSGKSRREIKKVMPFFSDVLKKQSTGVKNPSIADKTIKVGRNKPCPCGSGKKYKKCCLLKSQNEAGSASPTKKTNSSSPDTRHKTESDGASITRADLDLAKSLIKTIVGRLKTSKQEDPIDQNIQEQLKTNSGIVFPLLRFLIEASAPKEKSPCFSDEYDACLMLLEETLVELRYSMERKRQWAIDLVEDFQKRIVATVFHPHVELNVQDDIIRVLYNAKLPVDSEICAKRDLLMTRCFTELDVKPDIGRLFNALIAKGIENPFDLYEAIIPEIDMLPDRGHLVVALEMMQAENLLVRESAALLMLHPEKRIRTDIQALFNSMVNPETITPATLRRIIGFRNWIHASEQDGIDTLVKKIRLSRVECTPIPKVQPYQLNASAFDGSGMSAFSSINKTKKRYVLTGILAKQEEGIREVVVYPGLKKADVRSIINRLTSETVAFPVTTEYTNQMVSHFIQIGLQHKNPPPPALLHAAESMGTYYWIPKAIDIDHEFNMLSAEADVDNLTTDEIQKIIEQSGTWPFTMPFANSWFEDDSPIDDILKQANITSRKIDKKTMEGLMLEILNNIILKKYDVWRERLLFMTMHAKACKGSSPLPWLYFFVVTREFWKESDLSNTPLLFAIAQWSIISAHRRLREFPK